MGRREKGKQRIVDAAKRMPPLYHKIPDEKFSLYKARTLWWIVKQPEVLEFLWDLVKQSKAIVYNPSTGKWQGIEFEVEEDD